MVEIDRALGHHEVRGAGRILHKPGFVEDAGHFARVADGAVHALHHRVDVVEAHGELIGVGEHHDEHAARDAEPGVAARHENGHDEHDHGDDAACGEAALHGGAHGAALGLHGREVRLVEEFLLKILASAGLDGKDVGHGVR